MPLGRARPRVPPACPRAPMTPCPPRDGHGTDRDPSGAVRLLADGRLRAVRLPAAVLPAQGAHVRASWQTGRDGRLGGMRVGPVRGGPRVRPVAVRRCRWCRGGRRGSGPVRCRGTLRRLRGRPDELQRLLRGCLHDLRFALSVRARRGGPGRRGRRAGRGRPLDGHTTREGGDSRGDQERCGGRRSMHSRNSAVSRPLWGADKRRLPHMGDPSVPPMGADAGELTACARLAGRPGIRVPAFPATARESSRAAPRSPAPRRGTSRPRTRTSSRRTRRPGTVRAGPGRSSRRR